MWFFYSPTIIHGRDALQFVADLPFERVFVVTDGDLVKLGVVKPLLRLFKKNAKKWDVFSDVEPDPLDQTVVAAAGRCRDFGPDLIVGFGGGSSIDVAKGVWVLYENPDLGVDDIHPFEKLRVGTKARLLAIPTTSGTGAEATWGVILSRDRGEGVTQKMELAAREVIPTWAVLDPSFTRTMPAGLTAQSGFDALGHALESLVATWENDFTDALGLKAAQNVFEYLPRAVKDPDDLLAREKLQLAALMAGLAFGNCHVVVGHSMAHALAAHFHLPHGLTVALFLPLALRFVVEDPENDGPAEKLGLVAKQLGMADWSDEPKLAAEKLIRRVTELAENLGLPTCVADAGVDENEYFAKLDSMVELAMESSSIVTCPRRVDREELKRLFGAAWSKNT
ncbi:MAG: hypothetical protein Kow0069_17920 [Promethearchaeota archaeon]